MDNYENKYLVIPMNLKITANDALYIAKSINKILP